MTLNTQKTVSMVFSSIANEFLVFVVGGSPIKFVNQFKYLGHIVTDVLSDDDDILREVKNLFVPTNTPLRKFHYCSVSVKIVLFKLFFMTLLCGSHMKLDHYVSFVLVTIIVLKCLFFIIADMTV